MAVETTVICGYRATLSSVKTECLSLSSILEACAHECVVEVDVLQNEFATLPIEQTTCLLGVVCRTQRACVRKGDHNIFTIIGSCLTFNFYVCLSCASEEQQFIVCTFCNFNLIVASLITDCQQSRLNAAIVSIL